MIARTFQKIKEDQLSDADQQSFLVDLGWSKGSTWEDLLRSRRVLMISEAGSGKTYECRKLAQHLWDIGEPSFFVELATLASTDLRNILDAEEELRLDSWLSSQSDVATFFLDSIDELKLSLGSFEQALKRFKKVIGSQLSRARIVITTRPIPFDEQLIRRVLPIPPVPPTEPKEEIFAQIAMRKHTSKQEEHKDDTADWCTVALMPLSDKQIVAFAGSQGVENSSALLEDLRNRNAEEFARRPQDLIELCADWREHKRIRTHCDQVATNVRLKLQPREDRPELAELSIDKAIEGTSRLALAMLVTRRMTIRHSAASDGIKGEAALNPATILSDWPQNERKVLLERPLFGFASYGRVRFHHRSVMEYLAAERLRSLRGRGMPFRSLKRLLFAETKSKTIVRPSKRSVAGWLALNDKGVFELLRDHEPAVLLCEGDPESLSKVQRIQALEAYVTRYGHAGWRGMNVPSIQVHRFASTDLANEVSRLWNKGVENPDVRQTLLHIIELGSIDQCSDIAYGVVCNPELPEIERMLALDAMVALEDPRLKSIASSVTSGDDIWPDYITCSALLKMFPKDLSIEQLCTSLGCLETKKRSTEHLSWQLPSLIQNAKLDPSSLDALSGGLVKLISAGLRWNEDSHHIFSDRQFLSNALAATCLQGADAIKNDDWYHASALALYLHDQDYGNDKTHKALQERLSDLNTEDNARLFWAIDSLMQFLHPTTDPWPRLVRVTFFNSPIELRAKRDLTWIKEELSDKNRAHNDRAMLLEAAITLYRQDKEWREHTLGLKPLVEDQPDLLSVIDEQLKPSKYEKDQKRREKERADKKKQIEQQDAENQASWKQFWHEVAETPENAFCSEHSWSTAWNLWRVMRHLDKNDRDSGWNRRFIEKQFEKETADRLRRTLMKIWREEQPTLKSERPKEKRNTYLVRWELGLAGIYAEAEDPLWATHLSEEEATLASRHASIEGNALPHWTEDLVTAHPGAVDKTLGNELRLVLKREFKAHGHSQGHSMLLQKISHSTELVAKLFLPRLREWFDNNGDIVENASNLAAAAKRIQQVINAILKHGGEDDHAHLLAATKMRLKSNLPNELIFVWLPTLLRLAPEKGLTVLEKRLQGVEPGVRSEAVTWFSLLFGDYHDSINLTDPSFSPHLLLRFIRLAYHHVRPEDDVEHEGTYTPDTRDNAERARSMLVNTLFDAKGDEGWKAKLELANAPFCSDFKDRILAVAEENWAQEIDSVELDEGQAVALDKTGEAPATTNEAMFSIMTDRLADLDDLLLQDSSPREAWAGITKERVMRREIARELNHASNGLYKVDQESVTADEKETDIRLRSTVSDHEAVIELKLADGRSAQDLLDTIHNQLVKKYMAAERNRSGCLLITLAKEKGWKHPDSGQRIGLTELESLLHDEAKRVETDMAGTVRLAVHILDLRPRLPKEKARTRAASTQAK